MEGVIVETVRKALGISSLCLLAVALNWIVMREDAFARPVLVLIGLGTVFGLIWIVLRLVKALVSGKGAQGLNTSVGTAAWLGICVLLYALVRLWDASWDLTLEGRRELAEQTRQLLENLDEDVAVTCFFIRAGGNGRAEVAQDKAERFLARCQAYTGRLKVRYVDPQQDPEKTRELGVLRIQSTIGTVVLQCGARQREIPLSDVTARLEERDFTNALINVVRDSRPKVYFLKGHGERDINSTDPKTGGANLKLWLTKEAYDVSPHLIAYSKPSIPEDCSVLVINGYDADLRPPEIDALDAYLERGGRLLVLTNPQVIQEGRLPAAEQLRPWLETRFGIVVGSDIIVARNTGSSRVMFISDFNDLETLGSFAGTVEPSNTFRGSFNKIHPVTRGLDQTMMLSGMRTVELLERLPAEVSGDRLLRTTPDTWAESDLEGLLQQASPTLDDSEATGPNTVAVAVSKRTSVPVGGGSRMKEARVMVVGDADLSSNEELNYVSNQSFLLNGIAWLTENEDLIAARPARAADPPILLTPGERRAVAWLAALGPVQVIALIGLAVFASRRKYR